MKFDDRRFDRRRAVLRLCVQVTAAWLFSGPVSLPGQEAERGEATTEQAYTTLVERTFKIQHKKVDDVYLLVSGLTSSEGIVTVEPVRGVITVKDHAARVEEVSRVIENFDRPPDRVSFEVLVLKGTREPAGAPPPGSAGPAETVPRELKAVNYQRYERLASFTLEGIEGRNINAGQDDTSLFRLDIHVGHVDKSRGIIVLERFSLLQKVPRASGFAAPGGATAAGTRTSANPQTGDAGVPGRKGAMGAGGAAGATDGARIEFSDILMNNRPSVFGSARSASAPKALFVIIQGRIL